MRRERERERERERDFPIDNAQRETRARAIQSRNARRGRITYQDTLIIR